MTDNQEKELFKILATLVSGVQAVQTDVQGLKTDVQGLKTDVQGLKADVQEIKETQSEHSQILNEHTRILERLDAKTETIAETVINNDKRLTAVEKDVADLRGGVH